MWEKGVGCSDAEIVARLWLATYLIAIAFDIVVKRDSHDFVACVYSLSVIGAHASDDLQSTARPHTNQVCQSQSGTTPRNRLEAEGAQCLCLYILFPRVARALFGH